MNVKQVGRASRRSDSGSGTHLWVDKFVGQGKIKYLPREHGVEAMAVMAAIKRAMDPQEMMNPGKIF